MHGRKNFKYHQEFIHCTNINGICNTAFKQDPDGTPWVPSWSCSKAVYKPVWHIPLLSVQWIKSWWWTEELSETCRVSCQNKFVKLVDPVGFVLKKYVTIQHGHINVKFDEIFFSSIWVKRLITSWKNLRPILVILKTYTNWLRFYFWNIIA